MPTLDWIGKKAVLNHHKEVPFHLLKCDPKLSVGDPGSGNLLVHADNLYALKALLPYYAGKVKCIYIDPPYNTGNEKWIYNDAVNSPEIREWLGKVVGGESEDLSRHDKWLCMMYPRLKLLRNFLREDGSIFVSIDDNEVSSLRFVMNEIFGQRNFVASIIWQKRTSPDARINLGPAHDYIITYAKSIEILKKSLNLIPMSGQRAEAYKNPDNDPRGSWASVDLTGQTGHATQDQFYEITAPNGKRYGPPKGRCWALAKSTFDSLISDNRIWFGRSGNSRPRLKRFLSETEGTTAWTLWLKEEVGHNQEATKELNALLGAADMFETPKPVRLIKRILQLATDKDSIILDSFAGSGTTGHAVLNINQEDNGNRKFILVEMDSKICKSITYKRIELAFEKCYGGAEKSTADDNKIECGFRLCELGKPLFDEMGKITSEIRFADLAAFVYFIQTGEPIPKLTAKKTPLLGVHNGMAVYLEYAPEIVEVKKRLLENNG